MTLRQPMTAALAMSVMLSVALTQPAPQPGSFAITGVTIVDVAAPNATGALKANQTVVVIGDRIAAVGAASATRVPADARRIDGRGKFLIPGLWDMHVHLMNAEERVEYFPALFIVNGVTGIRDMGAALPPARIREIRASIDRGDTIGPRLAAVADTILEGPRGRAAGPFTRVTNETEARAAVDGHKNDGADFIKVYNGLPRELYLAIVDEAKRVALPVSGHVPASMSASELSDLGQRSIEHSGSTGSSPAELLMSCSSEEAELRRAWAALGRYDGPPQGMRAYVEEIYRTTEARAASTYDERKAADLFARFVRNGTWHVPTLVVDGPVTADQTTLGQQPRLKYMRPAAREQWQRDQQQRMDATGGVDAWKPRVERRLRLIGDMHRAGVSLLAGTDANNPYVVPGFSLHDELALLVRAGVTPLEALRTATLNPARFLNATDRFGSIERGKIADLVLLDANPLRDITATQRIHAVISNGRHLPRATLDVMLADVERIVSR
jgi:imidazolonepropionase-like amidohydrolase